MPGIVDLAMFELKNGEYGLRMQRLCFEAQFEGFGDTKPGFWHLAPKKGKTMNFSQVKMQMVLEIEYESVIGEIR